MALQLLRENRRELARGALRSARVELRGSRPVVALVAGRHRVHARVRPGSAQAQGRLAEALMEQQRREDGLAAWRRAIELDPDWLEAYFRLARELAAFGRFEEALDIYAEGIEAQEALAARRGLNSLGLRFLMGDWGGMIGHIGMLDLYAKLRILGLLPPGEPVLLSQREYISNPAYFEYWRRYFPRAVTDGDAVRDLRPLARLLLDHGTLMRLADGRLVNLHAAAVAAERQWEAEDRAPLLSLTDEDRERGRRRLEELGVPPGAWFVGLHVREGLGPRDRDVHNADPWTYLEAVAAVHERGGWVVRMGDRLMKPLPGVTGLIDYAHSDAKDDWMDVFLWAEGRFFIGTASGPASIPLTFGKPVVQTNWAPQTHRYWCGRGLMIPKAYWSEREQRYLAFEELFETLIGFSMSIGHLASQGVRLIDNTPAEIEAVVVEMIDRVEGRAGYTTEDERLQEKYDALGQNTRYPTNEGSRIGRDWLRAHAHLLRETP